MRKIDKDSIFSNPTISIRENGVINKYCVELRDDSEMVFLETIGTIIDVTNCEQEKDYLIFKSKEYISVRSHFFIGKHQFYIFKKCGDLYYAMPVMINSLQEVIKKTITSIDLMNK